MKYLNLHLIYAWLVESHRVFCSPQELLESKDYAQFETFYRQMFEIARRHKIMNPEKMRTEYGKLIYLLQDSVSPTVQPHLSFSCKVGLAVHDRLFVIAFTSDSSACCSAYHREALRLSIYF